MDNKKGPDSLVSDALAGTPNAAEPAAESSFSAANQESRPVTPTSDDSLWLRATSLENPAMAPPEQGFRLFIMFTGLIGFVPNDLQTPTEMGAFIMESPTDMEHKPLLTIVNGTNRMFETIIDREEISFSPVSAAGIDIKTSFTTFVPKMSDIDHVYRDINPDVMSSQNPPAIVGRLVLQDGCLQAHALQKLGKNGDVHLYKFISENAPGSATRIGVMANVLAWETWIQTSEAKPKITLTKFDGSASRHVEIEPVDGFVALLITNNPLGTFKPNEWPEGKHFRKFYDVCKVSPPDKADRKFPRAEAPAGVNHPQPVLFINSNVDNFDVKKLQAAYLHDSQMSLLWIPGDRPACGALVFDPNL